MLVIFRAWSFCHTHALGARMQKISRLSHACSINMKREKWLGFDCYWHFFVIFADLFPFIGQGAAVLLGHHLRWPQTQSHWQTPKRPVTDRQYWVDHVMSPPGIEAHQRDDPGVYVGVHHSGLSNAIWWTTMTSAMAHHVEPWLDHYAGGWRGRGARAGHDLINRAELSFSRGGEKQYGRNSLILYHTNVMGSHISIHARYVKLLLLRCSHSKAIRSWSIRGYHNFISSTRGWYISYSLRPQNLRPQNDVST